MSAPGTTPGPWLTDGLGSIHSFNGNLVCEIGLGWSEEDDAPRIADAHQIAASPALYDALEAMLDIAEVWEQLDCRQNIQLENSDTVAAARAALAQARGETA